MCSTDDTELNPVKNRLAPRQTDDSNVLLQATTRGIPTNPIRKSDNAKLARIMLLVDLKLEEDPMSRTTRALMNRMNNVRTIAGMVSLGIAEGKKLPFLVWESLFRMVISPSLGVY